MRAPAGGEQLPCGVDTGHQTRLGIPKPRLRHTFHPSTCLLQNLLNIAGLQWFFEPKFLGSVL